MDIQLSRQDILERCGETSFKKGEDFYRSNKVTLRQQEADYCKATVLATEAYHVNVTLQTTANGEVQATCTCPKLASFNKECQHIAAVLLVLYDQKKASEVQNINQTQQMSSDFLKLFGAEPVHTSRYQRHFEHRSLLNVEVICSVIEPPSGNPLIGVEIKLNAHQVPKIRNFLQQVKTGLSYRISDDFTYDPHLQCFEPRIDQVLYQLIKIAQDELVSVRVDERMLVMPASLWPELSLLLSEAPHVVFRHEGELTQGLIITDEVLPLQFIFEKGKRGGLVLEMRGWNRLSILQRYSVVVADRKFYRIGDQDFDRLMELKRMFEQSASERWVIPPDQVSYFLEKVRPALCRLGEVHLSEAITEQLRKAPLKAKVFLDRVKNRLLAGIEFHYETYVMNPIETNELPASALILRETEKEKAILELMEESGFSQTESGFFMHNEELEFAFLYEKLPFLHKISQVYATTAVKNRIAKDSFRPQIRVKVKKDRINWIEFKFEVKGMDHEEIREVLSALEEKRKFYRLKNGTFLPLESKAFAEVRSFINQPSYQSAAFIQGLKLPYDQCLQLLDDIEENETFKLEASFKRFIGNLQNPEQHHFELPGSLQDVLKDYQKQGFQWLKTLAYYGFGGILADDMGLGKTLQAIAFLLSELDGTRQNQTPALIICPSSLTYNWLSEVMKFAPGIKARILDGSKKERMNAQKQVGDVDLLITSYPILRSDISWYAKQVFSTIIFDEAQAFKNPITQTARAVKRLQATHLFALTGTPIENATEELWSIFHVVFPALFGGLKAFSELSNQKIAKRIRPFLLRRLKEEVLPELPQKKASLESVELFPEQKKLYMAYLAKLRHDTLKHLDKDTVRKNRIKILAGLTRLRQICCHPRLFVENYKGSSAKFEQLMQVVDEGKAFGRRILIFSQFTQMLKLIGQELHNKGIPFFYLHGLTPSNERVELCDRFNAGERDIFLISLKAGGTGLNLMSADTVILYDTWWNPAVEEQASDRAYRIGQQNDVKVIKLITRGTIEEKMDQLQAQKRDLIQNVIHSEEQYLSLFNVEEIKEILMN